MITSQNYLERLDLWVALTRGLRVIPREELEEALVYLNKLEAIGPFIDPTRFQNGGFERVAAQKKFLQGLADFRRVLDELVEEGRARATAEGA